MNENREERVRAKRVGDKVDMLSNLPESLQIEVLLNLTTKDVVRCSVLSSRWRNLWKLVPGLDLKSCDFQELDAFMSFVDGFLGFNSQSCIPNFKLQFKSEEDEPDVAAHFTRWINTVVELKAKEVHVSDSTTQVQIPQTVYTCKSLVSLKLKDVVLPNPEFVTLPCVKFIILNDVQFANDLAFEKLISGCPVLESLNINRNSFDNVVVLRVCSQSLLRFAYGSEFEDFELDFDRGVAIDAPRLKYLELNDHQTDSFTISNLPSLVKVNIDIWCSLDNPQKRIMFHKFLVRTSRVKEMVITCHTLENMYTYSTYETLPLFPNLSFLDIDFDEYEWETLLIFLGSCPNLKSLVIECPYNDVIDNLPRPQCFLSSLEFVKINRWEMKLVSYFLENSAILKKLTLCLEDDSKEEESVILKKLLTIPRLSASCQVVVLWSRSS